MLGTINLLWYARIPSIYHGGVTNIPLKEEPLASVVPSQTSPLLTNPRLPVYVFFLLDTCRFLFGVVSDRAHARQPCGELQPRAGRLHYLRNRCCGGGQGAKKRRARYNAVRLADHKQDRPGGGGWRGLRGENAGQAKGPFLPLQLWFLQEIALLLLIMLLVLYSTRSWASWSLGW